MSKGGTLRVKSLFKVKSPDKDNKEHRLSGHLKDAAGGTLRGEASDTPQPAGAAATQGSGGLASDSLPLSPKARKGLRLFFRGIKKHKSKDVEGDAEVFSPDSDDLDTFRRHW